MNRKKEPSKPNKTRTIVKFSGVVVQMGVAFYLAAYFGNKLDAHLENEKKIVTLIFIILVTFISVYSIIKQSKKIQR